MTDLYERVEALDDVAVLEVLEYLDLLEAVLPRLRVHHVKDGDLAWEGKQSVGD